MIPLRLTHEDLANLIGTTRETVTTQMIRFRRMGLVKRQDPRVRIRMRREGNSDFLCRGVEEWNARCGTAGFAARGKGGNAMAILSEVK